MYGKFTLLCSSLHIFLTVILLLLVRNIFQQIFMCFQYTSVFDLHYYFFESYTHFDNIS